MARDREAMGLVAYLLYEMQRRRIGRQDERQLVAQHEDLLLPRPARWTLRNARHRDALKLQLLQHAACFRDLPPATVDQQQVRNRRVALFDARIAARQGLTQGPVVVAGR